MFRELYLIVHGFVISLVAMFWVFLLLGLVMYCASIYLTSSVGMNEEYDTLYDIEYFDRTRLLYEVS